VLDVLERRTAPATLAALVAETGLHENTLREHLEALVAQGRVRRSRRQPAGRGRPAWLYEASGGEGTTTGRAEYAGLAATLASVIHRTSASPREDAVLAGAAWGRELARTSPAVRAADGEPVSASEARGRVVALLGELGFEPHGPAGHDAGVDLTRCPLLQAARRYPDVVCGVHLGIVRGVLAELGADGSGTELLPFSAPGACRLQLTGARSHPG
jgi:predicted ArsR family transcriptional regulator